MASCVAVDRWLGDATAPTIPALSSWAGTRTWSTRFGALSGNLTGWPAAFRPPGRDRSPTWREASAEVVEHYLRLAARRPCTTWARRWPRVRSRSRAAWPPAGGRCTSASPACCWSSTTSSARAGPRTTARFQPGARPRAASAGACTTSWTTSSRWSSCEGDSSPWWTTGTWQYTAGWRCSVGPRKLPGGRVREPLPGRSDTPPAWRSRHASRAAPGLDVLSDVALPREWW